ncbi:MAG: type II toxin-antitoxin system death-on-curing family toxin [Candidatus Methanoperedens sp.]|nr:type II toxin-antitoxin system death-on-curing family toxin [Candidatus Methanoperedens sp.]
MLSLLQLEDLLDINEELKFESLHDPKIEYSGANDYEVKISNLKKLIEYTPNRNIHEVAAYYLKNIILLQAFPDGNHRTALYAVELFLEINGYKFDYSAEEAYEFRRELYNRRLRVYKTYEERPIGVLKEDDNQVFYFCLEFIKSHIVKLTQSN